MTETTVPDPREPAPPLVGSLVHLDGAPVHSIDSPDEGGHVTGDGTKSRAQDGVPQLLLLAKTWAVLDSFTAVTPELTMREIVAATKLPSSTAVRIVRNLVSGGLLERDGEFYRIGLAIVRWAALALVGRDLVEVARRPLDRLRDRTSESAMLSVREGRLAVVVAVANSRHSIVRQLRIGEANPINAGSTGKVFLAFDPDALELIRSGALEARTSRTVTDRAQLIRQVDQVRRAGWASSFEERNEGAAGVTAPIFDGTGALVATIGISGPITRITPEALEGFLPPLLQAAQEIGEQLGHVPDAVAAGGSR